MQRYFIELSYNGTRFFGWQRQPNQISVQENVEDVLTKLHSNNSIKVMGCGRTDSGVHAKHFILHTDLPIGTDEVRVCRKMNMMLPESIAIHRVFQVENDAHARFDAKSRTYRYFINSEKNPFSTKQSWYFKKELDLDRMNKAAELLLGEQDFTSLSKVNTDTFTNICTVTKAEWVRTSQSEIYFEITANRFLRNMVRATVGTLMDIGSGKYDVNDMITILEAKNRSKASMSVPAEGLFLWKVEY